jgi:hypothetical protein
MGLAERVGKSVAVLAIVSGLLVSGVAVAVPLDQETFDACATVNDMHGSAPSRRDARDAAQELAALTDRTARKKLAPGLRQADTAKDRKRAAAAAYLWCDEKAGAYQRTALALNVPTVIDAVDTDSVTITGTSSPGATVTVTVPVLGGTRQATATADATGAFSAVVAQLPLGEWSASVAATAPLRYPAATVSAKIRRTESEGAFKASAREVDPDELKKDPAGLKGTRIYSRGEVFQYDSRTGLTSMLVDVRLVNPGRFEYWTDPVRLENSALGNGIDEKDIVEFWGEIQGAYSYGTAIGGTNTVPEIKVRYINLLEKR